MFQLPYVFYFTSHLTMPWPHSFTSLKIEEHVAEDKDKCIDFLDPDFLKNLSDSVVLVTKNRHPFTFLPKRFSTKLCKNLVAGNQLNPELTLNDLDVLSRIELTLIQCGGTREHKALEALRSKYGSFNHFFLVSVLPKKKKWFWPSRFDIKSLLVAACDQTKTGFPRELLYDIYYCLLSQIVLTNFGHAMI